ncbi:MAG: hypothetical protein K5746_01815 [Clostridiales bacterium]|nr:hypothetical protein [Clostridiales bacterium]
MHFKRAFRVFFITMLLFILLVPAFSFGQESTRGYIRVVGYKDVIPNCGRRFAPYAIFPDIPHAEEPHIYLAYSYTRYGTYSKVWRIWLTDGRRNKITTSKNISVCFPYPSIWSAKDGSYWKWTKGYAEKLYDWYYSKGYQYHDENWHVRTDIFYGTPLRPVPKMNEYGLMINIGAGLEDKSVLIHFVSAGEKPNTDYVSPLSGYNPEDEDEDEEEDEDW